MPKRRHPAKIPTPAWERPRGTIGQRVFGRSTHFYGILLVGLIVIVAIAVVGFAFWADYRADQQRPHSTALRVGDTTFDLEYFTERLKMLVEQLGGPGGQASANVQLVFTAVSQTLIQEEILRQFAGELGVSASEDEIKTEISNQINATPDAPDFDLTFQSTLSRTGLTEEQYRQLALAAVLSGKVQQKLSEGLPASAESVRYRQMLVSDDAAAQEVRGQVEGGADFAQLAREQSLDTNTKENGGEVGWVPRGSLEPSDEELIFVLEPNQLTIIPQPSGSVLVVQMLEKAADRPVDETQKSTLAQRAFQVWLDEKRQGLEIVNRVDWNNGDPEKIQWAYNRAYGQVVSGQLGG